MWALWVLDYWCEGMHSSLPIKRRLCSATATFFCVCTQSWLLSGFHTTLWYSASPWSFTLSLSLAPSGASQYGTVHACCAETCELCPCVWFSHSFYTTEAWCYTTEDSVWLCSGGSFIWESSWHILTKSQYHNIVKLLHDCLVTLVVDSSHPISYFTFNSVDQGAKLILT